MKKKLVCLVSLCQLLLFSSCAPASPFSPSQSFSLASQREGLSSEREDAVRSVQPQTPTCFFQQLTQNIVDSFGFSGQESDFEKIHTAFLYVVENTSFVEFEHSEVTESWRYIDQCGKAPDIHETMALGPLYYGIGTCEHYACALVVLLGEMGYEALYVPGLTYSTTGTLVDHAWVMVKVQQEWFHLDPQLEDNIVQNSTILYRYFYKNDETFSAHHVWGSLLKNPDEYSLSLPACTGTEPFIAPGSLKQQPMPTGESIIKRAKKLRFEAGSPYYTGPVTGSLPPLPAPY